VSLALYSHYATDTGRERTQNEDAVDIVPLPGARLLLIVCDGMGGQEAGDVASRIALRSILDGIQPAAPPWYKAIYDAFKLAQANVVSAAAQRNTPSMGTTAICTLLDGAQAWVGWIGDSRLYVFRHGQVVIQSADHTRVREMVDRGILTPEKAKVHPDAHILTRVIGGGAPDGFRPEVWKEPVDLVAGDVILLCSDGLYDLLDEREIYETIAGLEYAAAPRALIDAANARGGFDNISVALAVAGSRVIGPFPHSSGRVDPSINSADRDLLTSAPAAVQKDPTTSVPGSRTVSDESAAKSGSLAPPVAIRKAGPIVAAILIIVIVLAVIAYLLVSSLRGRHASTSRSADAPAGAAKTPD
jgi:serine/threonine protein phosphatase PrpC